jgi:hypothetical protein
VAEGKGVVAVMAEAAAAAGGARAGAATDYSESVFTVETEGAALPQIPEP